jgi:hypothetical protein
VAAGAASTMTVVSAGSSGRAASATVTVVSAVGTGVAGRASVAFVASAVALTVVTAVPTARGERQGRQPGSEPPPSRTHAFTSPSERPVLVQGGRHPRPHVRVEHPQASGSHRTSHG